MFIHKIKIFDLGQFQIDLYYFRLEAQATSHSMLPLNKHVFFLSTIIHICTVKTIANLYEIKQGNQCPQGICMKHLWLKTQRSLRPPPVVAYSVLASQVSFPFFRSLWLSLVTLTKHSALATCCHSYGLPQQKAAPTNETTSQKLSAHTLPRLEKARACITIHGHVLLYSSIVVDFYISDVCLI